MKNEILNKSSVEIISNTSSRAVLEKINCHALQDKEDAFFLADIGDIVGKFKLWCAELPRVEPFYAVKCNDDPLVLSIMAKLGCGFDCASKGEIQKILKMKVPPSRILYANPCKQNSHIQYAAKNKVPLMTFDNENELHKVKAICPNAGLILRILPPDNTKAQCQLGMKFGCPLKQVCKLLKVARDLSLNIVGVSFHVGSGCYDSKAYPAALQAARDVFDMGAEFGFEFTTLDIGGGFPGQKSAAISFEEICSVLRPALDALFPETMGVRIISEPGRFFVASAFTLVVNIIAKREVPCGDPILGHDDGNVGSSAEDGNTVMYYVNDGVYGSFNCLLYDHAIVEATVVDSFDGQPTYTSSVWGPTCDGLDCILKSCQLPRLETGDWIIFKDMGAYTRCAASNFNGMPKPRCYYVIQEDNWFLSHDAPYTFPNVEVGRPEGILEIFEQ